MIPKTARVQRFGSYLLLGLLLAASAIFAGCGGDEPDTTAQGGAESGTGREADVDGAVPPLPVDLYPPVFHLPLDDNAASPALRELSPAGLDQFLRNPDGEPETANYSVPGIVGSAIAFQSTGTSLAVPAAHLGDVFGAGSDFSLAFWWQNGAGAFPEGYRAILSNYTTEMGGVILYQRGSADGKYNRIYMNFYAAGNASPLLSPSVNVSEGGERWHHFIFQREGATLRAWRDGRLLGSHTDPVAAQAMGAGVDLRVSAPTNGVEGVLDELRIYPRALAPSEIGALASRKPGGVDLFLAAERLRDLKALSDAPAADIARVDGVLKGELDTQTGYPKPLGDHLELVAFRYRHIDGDDYEMAFAFRTDKRLSGDYFIHVRGWVDPSHAPLLPGEEDGAQNSQKWEISPVPPATEWLPGEIVIVRSWVKAVDVPYRMSLNLLDREEANAPLAQKYVELSWHASL